MSAAVDRRVHARTLAALTRDGTGSSDAATIELVSPGPGAFRRAVTVGDLVRPGDVIGALVVLGQSTALLAPETARGAVVAVCAPAHAQSQVQHGTALVTLDPAALGVDAGRAAVRAATAQLDGSVFSAPTSGRFYVRPAPGKAAFVSVGDVIGVGTTVCLLEVMKTFNRVVYGGPGLPARAKVLAIIPAEDADLNAGEAILRIEPA